MSGYTLIEVLIAGAILMVSIVAIVSMTWAVSAQQDANLRFARACNVQEQAARLYALGLSPLQIPTLLPSDPIIKSLVFGTENIVDIGDISGMEKITCTMVYQTGNSTSDQRTNTVVLVRPSVR